MRIDRLSYSYNENFPIFDSINLNLSNKKIYCIIGESGSGKTTLLSLLSRLETVSNGDIIINNTSINNIKIEKYRKEIVSMIFQDYNLIDYLNAVQNIEIALDINRNSSKDEKDKIIRECLLLVGISEDKWKRKVNKLSGGEQQRVAIARTIAMDTPFILADEPTGNLDIDTEEAIIELFRVLAYKHNKCVIIVTRSRNVAKNADIVYKLERGKLQEVDVNSV